MMKKPSISGLTASSPQDDSMFLIGLLVGVALVFSTTILKAEPHVVGFERFHNDRVSAEGGAILFSELGCANCHGDSPVLIPRKGPQLEHLKQRINHKWLADFLKNPGSGREGSTMPAMLEGSSAQDIEAVAAYLGTIGKDTKFQEEKHANAERGSALYHEKGCIACHAPTSDFKSPLSDAQAFDRRLAISHPDFKSKTSLEALNQFLKNPGHFRTDGRMPHIQLDRQESMDIAAHLMDVQNSDPRDAPPVPKWPGSSPDLLLRGKTIVQEMNCAACHDIPGEQAAPLQKITGNGEQDCLSATPRAGLPCYSLSNLQRDSLSLYLKSRDQVTDEDGKLTLAAMNCYACHERDGVGGPTPETNAFFIGDEALGDSGRLPPPLTGIGHKLKAGWLEGVMAGNPKTKVRPYLGTRMPAYPSHAKTLAEWFAKMDGVKDAPEPASQSSDLEDGRKLIGVHGGVNCITCHNWGERKSLGIAALDISSLNERLQASWFRSYMLDPAAYRPGTLMPALWPDGKSSVPDVLGGDSERQIGAIWEFIKNGKGAPEGFPNRSGAAFELVPQDKPVIQRTFLKKTGSKSILIGFPGGINLSYDGASGSPSLIWKGRFFDAYDTWFTRAAPFGEPLGTEIFELSPPAGTGRFRGYILDENGNPTLLTKRDGRKLGEHFHVLDGKLIRTVTWSAGKPPEITHPEGVPRTEESGERSLTITYF